MAIESGPVANVGDGRPLAAGGGVKGASDIDAGFRKHFGAGLQVKRWDGLFGTDTLAVHHCAFERVGAAQHAAGERDLTGFDSAADFAAGDDAVAPGNGRHDIGFKAVFSAELFESVWVAGGAVAEAKVFSDQDGAGLELIDQNFAHEILRGQLRDARVEWQDEDLVDTLLLDKAGALFGRGQQARGAFRCDQFSGMRVEREGGRAPAFAAGDSDQAAEDLPMADVDAIEIADGDGARAKTSRYFSEAAENHAASRETEISRPS